MATEIVKEIDVTDPSQDGWKMYYEIRRDDGIEVFVDAHCAGSAEVAALGAEEDPETLEYLEDRGRSAAIRYAEAAQARPGNVQIVLMLDPLDGRVVVGQD
ncbi:MAG TPA: hypothetical protein VKC65_00775 [Gaiellaceae bacterium]|nr:hypothetical protein [Gaiellaceae bacterium]